MHAPLRFALLAALLTAACDPVPSGDAGPPVLDAAVDASDASRGRDAQADVDADAEADECSSSLAAERSAIVFSAGEGGYHTFRIPALLRTPSGRLLAFAEGRLTSAGDAGAIDVVLKWSDDAGSSWSEMQLVASGEGGTAGNPTVVHHSPSDRLVLLFNRAPADATEARIRSGELPDARTGWVTTSDDDGLSWSVGRNVTSQTKATGWRWFVFGPGHGIQLRAPSYQGRLVFAADHSTSGGPEDRWLGSHLVYSDDGGDTFEIGAIDDQDTGFINPNEATLVELSDSRILVNARDQNGSSAATRAVATSLDGGESYVRALQPEPMLVAPVVHASILRVDSAALDDGPPPLLFSSPTDAEARRGLGLHVSRDEGLTWSGPEVLFDGPSAYSDLADMRGGGVGVLFEAGEGSPYETIRFQALDIGRWCVAVRPERG